VIDSGDCGEHETYDGTSVDLAGIGSGDNFLEGDSRSDTVTEPELAAGAGASTRARAIKGAGANKVRVQGGEAGSGASAGGPGSGAIGGPDSFDGPVGSAADSAASRAGGSARGLGTTNSGPGALASNLRESVDDLVSVPGLEKPPVRAVDDRFIMVPTSGKTSHDNFR
jgi:hypothetical protein